MDISFFGGQLPAAGRIGERALLASSPCLDVASLGTEPGKGLVVDERTEMSGRDHVAKVSTFIEASKDEIWRALTNHSLISQYMFGTKVTTDWSQGSPITWEGEWDGKQYQDKGTILEVRPPQILEYSHFSPLTGLPDEPANYHTVRIEVVEDGPMTKVTLIQDNNATIEVRDHTEKNWQMMLDGLKAVVEERMPA
jgi:uncharacterized protein YndB with AHSA1/START domain